MTDALSTREAAEIVLDKASVVEKVNAMPVERLLPFLVEVDRLVVMVAAAKKAIEQRILAEKLLVPGELWTGPDGVERAWRSQRRSEIPDPVGFVATLMAHGVSAKEISEAISKDGFRSGALKQIIEHHGGVIYEIVRDYTAWKDSPLHLTELEAKGKG